MSYRIIRTISALLVCALLLSGCSAGTATTAAPEAQTTQAAQNDTTAAKTEAATEAPKTEATEAETAAEKTSEAETAQESSLEPETEPETTAEPVIMYTLENLTMRAEASKEAEKLGVVPINSKVSVLDTSSSYFKIEYEGQIGFILGSYLTEDQEEAKQAAAEKKKEEAREKEKQKKKSGESKTTQEEEHQGMADQCNTDGLVGN